MQVFYEVVSLGPPPARLGIFFFLASLAEDDASPSFFQDL